MFENDSNLGHIIDASLAFANFMFERLQPPTHGFVADLVDRAKFFHAVRF